jgi:hypothetical protein
MSDRDERDKRRRVVDAGRRVTEHSSGDRQALNIPTGLGLWNPKKPGAYKIEIIPFEVGKVADKFALRKYAEPGDLYFERTYWMHARIGVNGDSYVCPAKTFGKPCPICEHRGILARSPKADDEKLLAALKPKERQMFLLVDHDELEKGVQLWEVSFHNFGKQLDAKINNADDEDRIRYRRFADPEEGLTLKLMASEETTGDRGGKYLEFAVDEFRPRKNVLDPDWLDHGFCLDDMVRLLPYDELKKIFLQTGDDEPREEGRKRDDRREREEPRGERERDDRDSKRTTRDDDEPKSRKKDDEPTRQDRKAERTRPRDEPKDRPPQLEKGDEVVFDYKDKEWSGRVVKVDETREVAHIEVEGKDRPMVVDLDDVRPAPAKTREPEPQKSRDKEHPADDDEPKPRKKKDDDESFRRRDADDDAPKSKKEPDAGKRGRDDDWDDEPPPRGRK